MCFFYAISSQGQTPNAPTAGLRAFTVHQVDAMFGSNQDHALFVSSSVLARRADGSWAHSYESLSEDGVTRQVLEFLDVAKRRSVHSEPVTQSVTTWHIAVPELPLEAGAGFKACDGSEKAEGLRQSRMLGYDVVEIDKQDGLDTEVTWVAPQLHCYPMQSEFRTGDGRRTTSSVNKVEEGDPSADLFKPPAGYAERTPTAIQALYSQKIPGAKPFSDSELPILEKRYGAAQRLH